MITSSWYELGLGLWGLGLAKNTRRKAPKSIGDQLRSDAGKNIPGSEARRNVRGSEADFVGK